MKTLLLIAGRSNRFWPLSEKSFFPIAGKSLIEHQIDRLKQGGCDDITLVCGPHNKDAAAALGLPIIEQKDMTLGTRGALLSALPLFGSEKVLMVCGNDVVDPSAYATVRETVEGGAAGALLAQKVESYFPGGYLGVDGDRITSIIEKPGEGNEPSDLVNIQIHAHGDASVLLTALQLIDNDRDDGYEQSLATLFADHEYKAVSYEGLWQAVKFPWHVLQVLPHLLGEIPKQSIHPSASVHSTAVIDGNVVIEEGAKVFEHAVIRGPSTIGKNAIVANNALVRGSSIGDSCVVGYNTEIKDSVLHSHVWTHMTYIGDSVVGRNVAFGAGCITANFRLDEAPITSVISGESVDTNLVKLGNIIGDNCRLGIQVSMSPGIKIGVSTFICSNTFVTEDIAENMYARTKDGLLKVSENTSSAPNPEERDIFRPGTK
ncbi:MAG: NTP transferase domain-containing protein [bacterium]|nr:NTP transferase domain-containing protein [bacterium]